MIWYDNDMIWYYIILYCIIVCIICIHIYIISHVSWSPPGPFPGPSLSSRWRSAGSWVTAAAGWPAAAASNALAAGRWRENPPCGNDMQWNATNSNKPTHSMGNKNRDMASSKSYSPSAHICRYVSTRSCQHIETFHCKPWNNLSHHFVELQSCQWASHFFRTPWCASSSGSG